MSTHAPLAPSAAGRWVACPGSVRLAATCPPAPSSPHAEEGTLAHALAAYCIQQSAEPSDYLGCVFQELDGISMPVQASPADELQVTEEMADAVQIYVEHVRRHASGFGEGFWAVEKKLTPQPNPIHPSCTGTADFVGVSPDKTLLVAIDYKHGAGVVVDAPENRQLLCYGGLAAELMAGSALRTVTLEIVQPRARRREEAVSRWTLGIVEFRAKVAELAAAALATEAPDAPLCAGDHCRWCPAKAICPALQARATEVAQRDFAVAPLPAAVATAGADLAVTTPPIPDDPQRLAYILQHEELVKGWLDACHQRALDLARAGTPIPGHKLVRKATRRKYIDEAAAMEVFGKRYGKGNVCEESLMPMGKLEKWLQRNLDGKKLQNAMELFNQHVMKPTGDLALAVESDPRPAESPSIPGEEIEFLLG